MTAFEITQDFFIALSGDFFTLLGSVVIISLGGLFSITFIIFLIRHFSRISGISLTGDSHNLAHNTPGVVHDSALGETEVIFKRWNSNLTSTKDVEVFLKRDSINKARFLSQNI